MLSLNGGDIENTIKTNPWKSADYDIPDPRRLKNGIMFRAARGRALNRRQKLFNKKMSRIRYVIERTFGGLKHHFGQGGARYVGLGSTAFDLRIASIAYNIKLATNLLPKEAAVSAPNLKNRATGRITKIK